MAKSQSRAQLKHVSRGQRPSASQQNAIIDFVRANGSSIPDPGGFSDQYGNIPGAPKRLALGWVRCICDDTIPPYGLVEVYDGFLGDDSRFYLKVRKPIGGARFYAGNEEIPLYAGQEGWVRAINPYSIVEVRAKATLSFMQIAGPSLGGDDTIKSYQGGEFVVVASSRTYVVGSAALLTGIILQQCAPAKLGLVVASCVQGAQSPVEIYAPPANVIPQSVNDLVDTGEQIVALFPFGAATSGMWCGLVDAQWKWIAYAIQCPASS